MSRVTAELPVQTDPNAELSAVAVIANEGIFQSGIDRIRELGNNAISAFSGHESPFLGGLSLMNAATVATPDVRDVMRSNTAIFGASLVAAVGGSMIAGNAARGNSTPNNLIALTVPTGETSSTGSTEPQVTTQPPTTQNVAPDPVSTTTSGETARITSQPAGAEDWFDNKTALECQNIATSKGDRDTMHLRGVEGYVAKHTNTYKLNSKKVSASLSLRDIQTWTLDPKKNKYVFWYDCNTLVKNVVSMQLVKRVGRKVKPISKIYEVGIGESAGNNGNPNRTINRNIPLKMKKALSRSNVKRKNIGVRDIVYSEPLVDISLDKFQRGVCVGIPKGEVRLCDSYPTKLEPKASDSKIFWLKPNQVKRSKR